VEHEEARKAGTDDDGVKLFDPVRNSIRQTLLLDVFRLLDGIGSDLRPSIASDLFSS